MKTENKSFIENTNIEDIPWKLLGGPYERGTIFPQWFDSFLDEHEEVIIEVKRKIALNFEHQETLWSVTPFVMLILRNILKKSKNPIVIVSILDLYEIIYTVTDDFMDFYNAVPLFSDLLQKKNLLPPISKNNYDEDVLMEYFDKIPDKLGNSFYYYSWLVLAYSINHDFPKLKEIQDDFVQKRLEKFENKAVNLILNNLLIND